MKKYKIINYLLILIICAFALLGCNSQNTNKVSDNSTYETMESFSLQDIPEFTDKPYVVINNNEPFFQESDYTSTSFEKYSELDSLGRCNIAFANIGQDLMPTEERGAIGMIKPSGWQTIKYDNVDGKYLYNRCHLIGYQLTAENANEKNIITGTRYLNIEGMLPFENMVADYIKETGNHVLYRVTPIYEGSNLLADGVLMEGKSIEDNGKGICFNIFAYNSQPGIDIDYTTGHSSLSKEQTSDIKETSDIEQASNKNIESTNTEDAKISYAESKETADTTYILNTSSHKFHKPSCSSVDKMNESNKQEYTGSREDLIEDGYEPCKICNP